LIGALSPGFAGQEIFLAAEDAGGGDFVIENAFGGRCGSLLVEALRGIADLVEFNSDLVFYFCQLGHRVL